MSGGYLLGLGRLGDAVLGQLEGASLSVVFHRSFLFGLREGFQSPLGRGEGRGGDTR